LSREKSGFRPFSSRLPFPERTSGFFYWGFVMEIFVNGIKETGESCSLAQLVERKELNPGALVVELNQQIIKQEHWSVTQLKDGDRLELLSFVGGG
jgi:sulfur carrier protein